MARRCHRHFTLSMTTVLLCASLSAPAADAVGELEGVVVSARKRAEAELDVPVSLTQFSSATLARLNVRSFDDYATKTSNLAFSFGTAGFGYAAVRSLAIRGITGEGTAGMYIDDMPVPESIDPRVIDIERIEVLKGPQGTLFGHVFFCDSRPLQICLMATHALICVVDDDESVRESLPGLLRELGYASAAFASAHEFLESGKVAATSCLILDIAMPGMSGPELQQQLGRRGQRLPIIFITGTAEDCERKHVILMGAVDCLAKPFGERQLHIALDKALSPERRGGS